MVAGRASQFFLIDCTFKQGCRLFKLIAHLSGVESSSICKWQFIDAELSSFCDCL